jgi:hypothetical protein
LRVGQLLLYIPVRSLEIVVRLAKYIGASNRRIFVLIIFVGIVSLARILVNKATRVRV